MAPNTYLSQQRQATVADESDFDDDVKLHYGNDNNSNKGGSDNTVRNGSNRRLAATVSDMQHNEIAIDGIIYNLDTFHHPGGESIKMFGGNDVTIEYRMIHPYHSSKELEKLEKVGEVMNYKCDYKFDTEFERELKSEVFKIVRRGREYCTSGWFARAFVYIGINFGLQYLWMTRGTSMALAIAFGVSQALMGMNVTHDATHGAASRTVWINDILGFTIDWIGASKWIWQERHWMHHTYTNHDKDTAIYGPEPFFIFHNYPTGHPKRYWFHRFQALYFTFVIALYWLSMVIHPETLTLKDHLAERVGMKMDNPFITSRRKYAIAIRILYFYCVVICPLKISYTITTAVHIFVMGVAMSLVIAFIFSLSHNFEEGERYPTKDMIITGEPVCWYKSQVEVTSSYGGFISSWLTGGINFHIEHHLFPKMSSAWYPYIAPKVREVCAKHGVKYTYFPWIHQNFYSFMKYMHYTGTGELWKSYENQLAGDSKMSSK